MAAAVTVFAACSPGEIRVAAVEDGVLCDYALWRPGRTDGVGDIHRGRVTAVMPGLAGAFVALEGTDGFLPDSAGAAGRGVGDLLLVRVVRAAQGGKGPRLAAVEGDPGAGPPARLHAGPNAVERLASQHAGPVIVDDPAIAALLRPALGERLAVGPALDDALASQIDALAAPEVALPGGLRATIHPTPALVAIDVDTAAASAGRVPKPAMQEALNRAMLPALARQIRLRNLSGAILIDLAGLTVRRRAALGDAIRHALAADPLAPRFLASPRFTALGLAEVLRPRIHPPLHELLAGPHAAGLAALRRIAADADPAAPPSLRAAPGVVAALTEDPAALPALAHRLGRPLLLRSDPGLPPCAWVVEDMHRA
ncbi:MAG: ribonuclease E/G [Acetobacteraceae bacterium]